MYHIQQVWPSFFVVLNGKVSRVFLENKYIIKKNKVRTEK
jgi:hypothetical protein